jgi:putative membrane protein
VPRSPRPSPSRSLLDWIGIYLRGMAMGVAELIPGVSGGTIAFITGIYVELVRSIRGLRLGVAVAVLQRRFREAWREGNLGFLAALGAGMAVSILLFAGLVAWLLEHREIHVWAFFFGLIVASVVFVGRFALPLTLPRTMAALGGVGVGVLLANIQPLPAPEHWISTFLAGPWPSAPGSFRGSRGASSCSSWDSTPQLVRALSELDLAFLAALAAGMGVGILAFARILTWLLRTRYRGTLAFLTRAHGGIPAEALALAGDRLLLPGFRAEIPSPWCATHLPGKLGSHDRGRPGSPGSGPLHGAGPER